MSSTAFDGKRGSIIARTRGYGRSFSSWCAVALGFTIPMSTAADNIVLTLLLVSWILSGSLGEVGDVLRTSRFARATWLLLGALVLGLAWGPADLSEGLQYVGKYKQLLFVPLLMAIFALSENRENAIKGFSVAMAITLIASYAVAFGIIPTGNATFCGPSNPCVLKSQIAQNYFMAFAAFIWFLEAGRVQVLRFRLVYIGFALAAAFNVLFMVIGRTGHVAILVLVVYWAFARYRWRGLGIATAAITILVALGLLVSATFVERMKLGVSDVTHWHSGDGPRTSMGGRMDMYRDSLRIIGDHPLIGVGTGGLGYRSDGSVSYRDVRTVVNPHSQYILMVLRLGLLGAASLLYLFFCHWREAGQVRDGRTHMLAMGLLLIMMTGCLFNSLLMDHAEGWFYVWFASVLFARHTDSDKGRA